MKKRTSGIFDEVINGLLIVFFLPVVGLYLMSLDGERAQNMGRILFVVGLILWLIFVVAKASC